MIRTKKQLYYAGKVENTNKRLNIFILELDKNKEIANILASRFNVIWYINNINKNDKAMYINIAEVSTGSIYINKNTCIEEVMYYLMKISDVIVVGKIEKIKEALDIIDIGLSMGKEVVCIKNSGYLANKLINDGAKWV